jgi:formylglycine-generating enzyme required for sulfatase activity
VVLMLAACTQAPAAELPDLISIPAGSFIVGSDRAEREMAYRLDEAAYGHAVTRQSKWYENEPDRGEDSLPAFAITRTPITNRHYAAFIAATGRATPDVDPDTWRSYKLIHPYERTRRHAWRGGAWPNGRAEHPVVLVSHADAAAYAAWLTRQTGRRWRLPTEREWEKAVRGTDGRIFPWGDEWDPARLNSHDQGPFDTLPVGSFPGGTGSFGLQDGAGQVFEWTATEAGGGAMERYVVKGGSWDDSGCGVCRPAARHTRPANLKHILIGFRLVAE